MTRPDLFHLRTLPSAAFKATEARKHSFHKPHRPENLANRNKKGIAMNSLELLMMDLDVHMKRVHTNITLYYSQIHRVTRTHLAADQGAIFRKPDFIRHENNSCLLHQLY